MNGNGLKGDYMGDETPEEKPNKKRKQTDNYPKTNTYDDKCYSYIQHED